MNKNKKSILYISGAGVSVDSGIPTFRGLDGVWTIGSKNFTPQEMATRRMYTRRPDEFLLWYFKRFALYRDAEPNEVHRWLSSRKLITQNVDGLDGKAGNKTYIPIHGRIDKVTKFIREDINGPIFNAPWHHVFSECNDFENEKKLRDTLLDAFRISKYTLTPEFNLSLKPYVLLFDEYYSELYRFSEAEEWITKANHVIFLGTSFSVNITTIALQIALKKNATIEIIDPNPTKLCIPGIKYNKITALDYVKEHSQNI